MLRKLTVFLSFLLCMIVIVLGCGQGDKKVVLRYGYEQGLTLNYEQSFKRSVKVIEDDSIIKDYSSDYRATIVQEITKIYDDGSAALTEIDTWFYKKPSGEDTTIMEEHEFKRKLKLKMRPDGKVLKVEFPDKESKSSISYIKNIYEQGMPVFPTEKISPDYSWTQTTNVKLPNGTMEASTTYRFQSVVKKNGYDCAVIECDGNLIIPIEAEPDDSLMRTGVDQIQTTGKLYFAFKEGIVILQQEQWLINGDRTKNINGKKKNYKVDIRIDTEFKLVKRAVVP